MLRLLTLLVLWLLRDITVCISAIGTQIMTVLSTIRATPFTARTLSAHRHCLPRVGAHGRYRVARHRPCHPLPGALPRLIPLAVFQPRALAVLRALQRPAAPVCNHSRQVLRQRRARKQQAGRRQRYRHGRARALRVDGGQRGRGSDWGDRGGGARTRSRVRSRAASSAGGIVAAIDLVGEIRAGT